jgi:hypothetical protein
MEKIMKIVRALAIGLGLGFSMWFGAVGIPKLNDFYSNNFSPKPEINIRSKQYPFAKEFSIGEELDIKLNNVATSSVFWLYNENEIKKGSTETIYPYGVPKNIKKGEPLHDIRVDAIFKQGEKYTSISTIIPLKGKSIATFKTNSDTLVAKIPTTINNTWHLDNVDFVYLVDGNFVPVHGLQFNKTTNNKWILSLTDSYYEKVSLLKDQMLTMAYNYINTDTGNHIQLVELHGSGSISTPLQAGLIIGTEPPKENIKQIVVEGNN